MYGLTLLHKFFLKPPIFPSEDQKKGLNLTNTRIMDHHLTFLQLLELPCTLFHRRRYTKLTEARDLPVPLSASKTLERAGCYKPGGGASAPPKSALVALPLCTVEDYS